MQNVSFFLTSALPHLSAPRPVACDDLTPPALPRQRLRLPPGGLRSGSFHARQYNTGRFPACLQYTGRFLVRQYADFVPRQRSRRWLRRCISFSAAVGDARLIGCLIFRLLLPTF